jgi:membrane protease YdiL (CAAX protease family)
MIGMFAMVSVAYLIRHLVIFPLHLRSSLRVDYLQGLQNNPTALARVLALVVIGVGLNEELQFRGFVQSRLAAAFGGAMGRFAAVVMTGMIFGLAHFAWGTANMVYASLPGMLLGGIYLWADGNLWVPVILHSLFDVTRAIQWFLIGNDLPT